LTTVTGGNVIDVHAENSIRAGESGNVRLSMSGFVVLIDTKSGHGGPVVTA
jgi:hypothetical protein